MSYYSDNVDTLFDKYHCADSAELHADWLKHLPDQPGLACDIGAGTGRDANWLARKGWQVTAVEPENAFRERGKRVSEPGVSWLDDRLPELAQLRKLNRYFDLILISAVWMHLPEAARARAFRTVSELLASGGKLIISLRHSDSEKEMKERCLFPVSLRELELFAKERAVAIRSVTDRADDQGRDHVSWQTVVLELPHDDTT